MAGKKKVAKPKRNPTQSRTSNAQARRQQAFLAAFSATGVITTAAEAAQIDRSTHYEWLEDPDYEKRFHEAEEQAADILESEARRRAVEGVTKPIYQGKELVGHVQEYSDTLLTFLLSGRRKAVFSKRSEITGADGEPLIPQDLSETRILTALGGILHLRELEEEGAEGTPVVN